MVARSNVAVVGGQETMDTLEGVVPALVTPRLADEDEIDVAALEAHAAHLLDAGVDGLFAAASTGEAPLLTHAQRRTLVETVVRVAAGRVPVLAGVGAASTAESIVLARDAAAAGATHVVVLPLHFRRTSPRELEGYFAAVAGSVDLPVILYNFPALTSGQNIPADVASRLSRSHRVVGVKDSSGDLSNMMRYKEACGPGFRVYAGSEALVWPLAAVGGDGTLCAGANVYPRLFVALWRACKAGDAERALALQKRLLPLPGWAAIGTFPAAAKAALRIMDRPVGPPFLPALPVTETEDQALARILEEIGDDAP
jgi:4-hydroxy-tetrahydrodipicolinate synthase